MSWHGEKVGPGPQDLGTWDPGPSSKFKSGTQDPLRFKSWNLFKLKKELMLDA